MTISVILKHDSPSSNQAVLVEFVTINSKDGKIKFENGSLTIRPGEEHTLTMWEERGLFLREIKNVELIS